jgi:CheY-like chemotaxis protein
MQRVLLIHWHAKEAEARAERLRRAGYLVEPYSEQGAEGLKKLRQAPPDAVVVDLSRLPSHGRAAGLVDYKICSIDATWSGLRFAAKKARGRPG